MRPFLAGANPLVFRWVGLLLEDQGEGGLLATLAERVVVEDGLPGGFVDGGVVAEDVAPMSFASITTVPAKRAVTSAGRVALRLAEMARAAPAGSAGASFAETFAGYAED